MIRDLLIGGDQLRALEQKPAKGLWRLALACSLAALVLTVGTCALLPFEITWGPLLLASLFLGFSLLLSWGLVSMLAVAGGARKAGGAAKQLPILLAATGFAAIISALCMGLAYTFLHLYGDNNAWPLGPAALLIFAGISSPIGVLAHAWTHLLGTPLWLALLLGGLATATLLGSYAVWGWLLEDNLQFDPMVFI